MTLFESFFGIKTHMTSERNMLSLGQILPIRTRKCRKKLRGHILFAFFTTSMSFVSCGQSDSVKTSSSSFTIASSSRPITDTPLISEQDPDWSASGQYIAYSASTEGNEDIWILDLASGNTKRLTTHPARDIMPRWSPDDNSVVFVSNRGSGQRNLWTISSDGDPKSLVQVTHDHHAVGDNLVNWSPDGAKLLFSALDGDNANVWTISSDGSNAKQITNLKGVSWDPDWSQDGKSIAFNYAPNSNMAASSLWVASADGGNERSLNVLPATEGESLIQWCPAWSPDGNWLTFCGREINGNMKIWLVSSEGGIPIDLTLDFPQGVGRPRWSPDGNEILFSPVMGVSKIAIYDIESGSRQVFIDSVTTRFPPISWAPNGESLLYTKNDAEGTDIWRYTFANKKRNRVTAGGSVSPLMFVGLASSPDGNSVAYNSEVAGTREIWTLDLATNEKDRITVDIGESLMDWSPDGENIIFNDHSKGSGHDLWLVPSTGGVVKEFVRWEGHEWGPVWSPDGKYIAFTANGAPNDLGLQNTSGQNPTWTIWTVSVEDKTAKAITEGVRPSWDATGNHLFYGQGGNLYRISTTDGTRNLIIETASAEVWPYISPDGKSVAITEIPTNDLWVVNVEELVRSR